MIKGHLSKEHAIKPVFASYSIALFIGIFGIIFRSYALRVYSDLPAGFDGSMFYRRLYVLDHHQFILEPIRTYSFWSNGVNMKLGIYLQELVFAGLLGVSSLTSLPLRFVNQILLSAALIGIAVMLLLQGKIYQKWPPAILAMNVLVIASLSTLGTPVVINYISGWTAAYGWPLFLAVTLVVTSKRSLSWKLLMTFLLAALGPPLYHTFGFFLFSYMILLWVFSNKLGLPRMVVSPLPLVVYYLTYQMYVSTDFFNSLLSGLVDVLRLDFLTRDPIHTSGIVQTSTDMPYLRYLNLLLWLLLCIPIAVVIARFVSLTLARAQTHTTLNNWVLSNRLARSLAGILKQNSSEESGEWVYLSATTAASVAVLVISAVFAVKLDLTFMINRGAEYLILPALLAVITELRYRPRQCVYIYPLTFVVVSTSLFSFWVQSSTVQASNYISWAEAEGYEWLAGRIDEEDVVFTDFRLSGPFIANGHFRVFGITGQSEEETRRLLNQIYFESSSSSITDAIDQVKTWHDNQASNYLFLSKRMLKEFPGIIGFGSLFGRAPNSFFQALDESPDWELVYQNAEIRIYKRE